VVNPAEDVIMIVDKVIDTITGWDVSNGKKATESFNGARETLSGLVASMENAEKSAEAVKANAK
jgi:hypothetical protein